MYHSESVFPGAFTHSLSSLKPSSPHVQVLLVLFLLSPGFKLGCFVIAVAMMATNHHFTHEILSANRQQIKEGVFPQYLSHEVNPCPGHPQPCHYQVQAPHFPAPLLHRTPPPASILTEEIGWLPGCYFHKTLITGMEHDSDRCTRNFAKFSKDKFTKKELRHLLLRHLQFKRQIYKHLLLACSENQGSC